MKSARLKNNAQENWRKRGSMLNMATYHPVQDSVIKVTQVATPAGGIGTMVMQYFNANAAGIGAICTIVSLVVYMGFTAYKVYRQEKDRSEDDES